MRVTNTPQLSFVDGCPMGFLAPKLPQPLLRRPARRPAPSNGPCTQEWDLAIWSGRYPRKARMAGASRSSAKVVSQQAGHKGGAGGQPLAQADRVTQSGFHPRQPRLRPLWLEQGSTLDRWHIVRPSWTTPVRVRTSCWSGCRHLVICKLPGCSVTLVLPQRRALSFGRQAVPNNWICMS